MCQSIDRHSADSANAAADVQQETRQPSGHSPVPTLVAVETAVPPHRYRQEEITSAFADVCLADEPVTRQMLARISANAGVEARNLSLPLDEYPTLDGFTGANEAWRRTALRLGEEALHAALQSAGVRPDDVDLLVTTTVTGLSVPSIEVRLAQRLGMRENVKRLPLFGLGCAAGAAGVARLHDYLLAFPNHVAVLLSVELCSLTIQRGDTSTANLVACSLFGDGAAAVVAVGADRSEETRHRSAAAPGVLATRSRLYPESEEVMGWRIGSQGFSIVLSPDVARVAEEQLPKDVHDFLGEHALTPEEIERWVCHPGGPKVIQAVERSLGLPPDALADTRRSLAQAGNLSSASVLDVLRRSMISPPPGGSFGLLTAMGPGFASELVLLRW